MSKSRGINLQNEGGELMKKGFKTTLIIVVSLVVVAVLMHLTMNYLVPFVVEMHSGGAY